MKSVSRGILAVVGIIPGFLTLVFLSQSLRYLSLALIGNRMALGMFGLYVILSFIGATGTVISFRPNLTTVKYLSGVGIGISVIFFLSALYLFTGDISSGMMLLIFSGVQMAIAGGIYGIGVLVRRERSEDSDFQHQSEYGFESTVTDSDSRTSPPDDSHETGDYHSEYDDTDLEFSQSNSSISNSKIDVNWDKWLRGGQVFVGLTIFIIGIPLTIQSPLGVPILLVGLGLIPAVRRWGMEKLGGSASE